MFKRYLAAMSVSALLISQPLPSYAAAQQTETPVAQPPQTEQAQLTEQEQQQQQALALWNSLNRITGEVQLADNAARLNITEDFYFLNSADAEKVLVDVWGNMPGQNVLGMIMPAQYTPFDRESWAVTFEYEQDGYVSDENAQDIDYNELLEQLKEDTKLGSEERVKQGYEPIELIGWAANPYYDSKTNKLHWAKEYKIGEGSEHTLNYNIRILGRKGVLVLNFIAGMEQKAQIEQQLESVLAMANFNEGSRYSDFNPDIDEVAAYGIGALVAGKVLAKTGFIAILLVFLKKFGVFIVVGIGALISKLWKRNKTSDASA